MLNFMLETTDAAANAGIGGTVMYVVIIVAMIAVFYFLTIRPQKKQERELGAMRDSLQVGDEITTIGGVIGQIVSIKDETITIVTSKDRTKIRFLKSAVSRVDVKAEDAIKD